MQDLGKLILHQVNELKCVILKTPFSILSFGHKYTQKLTSGI